MYSRVKSICFLLTRYIGNNTTCLQINFSSAIPFLILKKGEPSGSRLFVYFDGSYVSVLSNMLCWLQILGHFDFIPTFWIVSKLLVYV